MSIITTERLTKILSETQAVITECNSRGVHGSVEVNARLFENVLMELLRHRAAMLQGASGNSPVIPDGWVACSERMPEVGVKVLCFPVNDEPIHATYNGQVWLQDISWSTSDEPIDNVISCNVFHWMPLPAAPDFREISNSSTNNCRENAETSTNCPCCGRKPLKNKTCSVAGCDGKHVARGFCAMHYAIERKKDPSRRESIRAADKRYRARKVAAPQQEVK
ncbi:DUF551 domain-containing protein [Enterobacter hormaechei]|uniref:DUF551 domain-containing protein n=1 Tax=Enterobacter cloacae complex TaxID=354276 RepID=UPI00101209CF|nr:DUF551 domain-containing protein [Enterobacter cloacae complex sp. 743-2DZ2F-22B]RYA94147.1 hypothetical protein DD602_08795 [Enterobacter cloacae complex sp. 743-2DZ2F-22B]